MLSDHIQLLHAVAERLLEKEVLDGSEVEAMVTAFREGRELPRSVPVAAPGEPTRAADPAREKPRKTEEEPAIPGLPPKPVLA